MKLSASAQLTAAYLAILMLISVTFSAAIYQTSVASLEDNFLRQTRIIQDQGGPMLMRPQLDRIRLDELEGAKKDIVLDLVAINMLILVVGGLGSHWLANRTLRPIEDALDAQSRFTADASHELRTPLTAMQTEIEVSLRDKKLKLDGAKGLLKSNLEEIAKLRALAEGLLTLSRHQSGDKINFGEVSIKEVVDEARKRLGGIIEQTKTELKIVGDDVRVEGGFESLVGLLVILLDNAIKYSDNTPKVEVAIKSEKGQAVVEVKDKGLGIKASDLPHIFDRFYRADSSRSKATEGYGLGLSIAKQIVLMHNGSIGAQSAPDEGTTIVVKIPQTQPNRILPV